MKKVNLLLESFFLINFAKTKIIPIFRDRISNLLCGVVKNCTISRLLLPFLSECVVKAQMHFENEPHVENKIRLTRLLRLEKLCLLCARRIIY
eukprot:UN00239